MKIITTKILIAGFLVFCMSQVKASHSDAHYEQYINSELSTELPSDAYYNHNLRAGPPTGPGGSGEGGNEGTGTEPMPLGDALLPLITACLAYGIYVYKGKRKLTTLENEYK